MQSLNILEEKKNFNELIDRVEFLLIHENQGWMQGQTDIEGNREHYGGAEKRRKNLFNIHEIEN